MSDHQNMSIDRVTLGVLGNVLHGISREMGVTMRRTSYSNIFNEGYDYTCGIFNSKGQIVVQDEHVPILIASNPIGSNTRLARSTCLASCRCSRAGWVRVSACCE